MELALTLGGDIPKPILFLEKSSISSNSSIKDVGFCMVLGKSCSTTDHDQAGHEDINEAAGRRKRSRNHHQEIIISKRSPPSSTDPSLQLDLLPFSRNTSSSPLHFPWLSQNLGTESAGIINGPGGKAALLDMNRRQLGAEEAEEGAALSSPNSEISSFQMNFPIYRNGKRDTNSFSRAISDEDNNNDASARKKLRLTKDQSAFLEESFKEHNTLNPKQKLALAKQLNLRPRQVEVWFQNRRARTKLKQTEVDCEYLKKCCETLTEENKRLHKELQELRALKSSQPFYMQLPATTLTMCPSCERVATTTVATTNTKPPAPATPTAATANTAVNHNHKLISLMTK